MVVLWTLATADNFVFFRYGRRTAIRAVFPGSSGRRFGAGGMRQSVDFLQFVDRHLSIDFGRLQTGVAQHLLDVTDVGAVLEHVAGTGMS